MSKALKRVPLLFNEGTSLHDEESDLKFNSLFLECKNRTDYTGFLFTD